MTTQSATMSVWPEAAGLLGIGRDTAYGLAHTGWLIEGQVPVWRLRGTYRVPAAALYRALGLDQPSPS
jgi:excisionase family DNA binding protein